MSTKDPETYDTDALKDLGSKHLWLSFAHSDLMSKDEGFPIMVSAEGSRVVDTNGREYLDGISALEAMVVGHGRAELVEVAAKQMQKLAFLDVFRYTSVPAIELAAKIADLSPGSLNRVFFTPGGAEADEVALKIARQYFFLKGEPQRQKIITRSGAFHGSTFGVMGLDGNYWATRNYIYESGSPTARIASAPACPKCDYGKASRHLACPHKIEETIIAERPETIAAVVVDPAATAIAVAVPPPEYLVELRRICDKYGVLLIVDEVITGFGRTGRMFNCEYSGIVPDMITMSKGLSSGYMPIGAAVIREEIAEIFVDRPDATLAMGHTYGGHPVACAVALENIAILEREGLPARAEKMGRYLLKALKKLDSHPSFWDARGVGLLAGVELVADKDGTVFMPAGEFGTVLRKECRDNGLITLGLHPGNVMFFSPPLTVTEAEIDEMVAIFDAALTRVEAQYGL